MQYEQIDGKNEYRVIGIGEGDSPSNIEIPATYKGSPVTNIGAESFTDKCFESIVIPDSVTSIGSWVFSGCDSLASITFENTVGWELSDGTDIGVTNPATNATYLEDTYAFYLWLRK